MFEVLSAIPECAKVVVPEATAEAMRYYHSGNILWICQQAAMLFIPLLFLFKGFTSKLAHLSQTFGKNWFLTIFVYLILFIAIYQLLNLPLELYAGYFRQHEYGLSTKTLSRWFSNYGKETFVTMISAVAFVWIFYLLLKKSPRRWWFYGALVSTGIAFLMTFVQPIWIDPLFNQFGPMKNKRLEKKILQLAARAGIDHGRVFEVDKSQDTNMLNAYVVGFGSTNRIVLWDTTIKKMTTDEILFVMGHEMGHYVLHHMWWLIVYFAVLSFAIFYLTYRVANFILKRYSKKLKIQRLDEIASLPLFLFLLNLWMFLSMPLSNYVSRAMERQADRFGLEITQNNQAAGKAFLLLQQQNLVNPRPGPLYMVWRASHPSLGERVDFCNHYCPWKEHRPLEYSEYFKD